jgi:NDP-sugar pyrophosphorylase family protein
MALGDTAALAPLNEQCPEPLLPLVDRPVLQHLIEYFANQGVKRFDIVLSHFPEKVEQFLGDGQRWGSSFTFHLARDPSRPYWLLKALNLSRPDRDPLLFGHADRIPPLALDTIRATLEGVEPLLFYSRPAPEGPLQWTGWALISAEHIATLASDSDEKGLEEHLRRIAPGEQSFPEVGRPLDVSSFSSYLTAHHTILAKQFPGLLLNGREVEPGIWLSRNVVLHPTAQLFPPVYIGDNCEIGLGVKVGPDVVIGHGSVLDNHCMVTRSHILPGSYVGQHLELEDVLVDRNLLINARVGGAMKVKEVNILASMSEGHLWRGMTGLLARVLALILLVPAIPVLLLTALILKIARPGPVLHRKEVVQLPATGEPESWQTFKLWSFAAFEEPDTEAPSCSLRRLFLQFLPALVNVLRGQLRFVGVPPRNRQEIQELSPHWRSLYLGSKPGIVTEAAVRYNVAPTEDESYSADTYYAVTARWSYDARLLGRYLARCVFGVRRHLDEEPVLADSPSEE